MRQRSFEIKSWYPPLSYEKFRWKNFSENWRNPLRNFSVLWENHISTKSWYTILCNFFIPEFFLKKRAPLGVFSIVWDKNVLRESRDIPLLAIKSFDNRKYMKNEGFPYEVFRYCEKINFRQNRDTPSYAIFLIQKFSEKKVPLGISSVLWDKKVSRENRDLPFLATNLSMKEKFSKMNGSPSKIFGTVRKSIFDKIVVQLLMQFI